MNTDDLLWGLLNRLADALITLDNALETIPEDTP